MTVDITKRTVPILAETKKNEKKKKFKDFSRRISTKNAFEKNPQQNRNSRTEIRKPSKAYTAEIKKCNKDIYK